MTHRLVPKRRGHMVLGLILLIFVLVTFCGLVLRVSLEMYREQVFTERRHQVQASVEAAVAVLIESPARETAGLEASAFRLTFEEPAVEDEEVRRSVVIDLHGKTGEPIHTETKNLVFQRDGERWHFRGTWP